MCRNESVRSSNKVMIAIKAQNIGELNFNWYDDHNIHCSKINML